MRPLIVAATLLTSQIALASEVYTDTSEVHACAVVGGATIAATGGGLVVTKDGASRVLTAQDGLPDTRAYAVLASADGTWVGTDRGAVLLDERLAPKRTALDSSVRALVLSNGHVLAGTFGRGIADLASPAPPINLSDARVLSLATFGGSLYAGTMTGVFKQTGPTFASISSDPAFALRVDSTGVHAAPETPACTVPASGMPSNDVSAVVADASRVWVGTFNRGLARLERGRFTAIAGVDRRIDALALDKKTARVWVGTARGLYAVDGDAGHLVAPGDEVHALAALDGGGVLAGTSHGALLVQDATTTRIGAKEGMDVSSVTAVQTRGETLYLGTTGGLFVGAPGKLERLSVASGQLPDDWVTALAISGGVVYAGTYNAGVVRLDKTTGAWRAQRLGGGYVNPAGLTLDGDTLYVATMDGLFSSTNSAALSARDRASLGRDVTGVAVSPLGTFVASRRGVLKL